MNGGLQSCSQDSEVAKITAVGDPASNIVHLKDPKHIQGFGSNVVHVNVSCGQTLPEATNSSKCGSRTEPSKAGPADAAAVEEDEDAQTFIIQLTEEQTRQLAAGNLKLNGVPIPKDLSNLTYE